MSRCLPSKFQFSVAYTASVTSNSDVSASLGRTVILHDIGLPTLNGLDAGRQIRKIAPKSKIIFVTQESSGTTEGIRSLGSRASISGIRDDYAPQPLVNECDGDFSQTTNPLVDRNEAGRNLIIVVANDCRCLLEPRDINRGVAVSDCPNTHLLDHVSC